MTKHAWGIGLWVCVALLVGCGDDEGEPPDAGAAPDAGAIDAGTSSDAGTVGDAGVPEDGGGTSDEDAGTPEDGGLLDGGALDGGTADAGGSDAGGGTGPTPGPGDLVVVEIQGNPQMATDEQAEYVELLNVSGRELDLQGVQLAHVAWSGGEPVASVGSHTIASSVIVAPGARVLLARSGGGYFGGATRDYVYDGFAFSNGGAFQNRLRVMVPSWDGSEPPAAGDVVDEVRTPAGAFDNPVRGRALQLDPSAVPAPSAAGNDDPADWCHAAEVATLEYRAGNWGTPRGANRCD